MKITDALNSLILTVFVFLSCYSNADSQTNRNETISEITKETASGNMASRQRMNIIKTVDFHLRSGELVYGKIVSEDKNKITVESRNGSRIVVSTYSRREIEPRTVQTKSVPEYRYYLDLAEYFSARTWDFKDDPDDFIQAIRSCEKARQLLLETQKPDKEKIEQISQKITKLHQDRQIWEREVQSRAKLKTLEFEAEVENRLKELEDKFNVDIQQVNQRLESLDEFMGQMRDNSQRLEQNISGMNQEITRQLNILADRVEANRRLIDPWGTSLSPRYYYPSRPYYYSPRSPGEQRQQ